MKIPNCVVTIGVFDGVHLGHRAVVNEAISLSRSVAGTVVAVTFDPHPDVALGKPVDASLITTPLEKACLFAELGIEFMLKVVFNAEVAGMDAGRFIEEIIMSWFEMKTLVVGHDFCMGRDRRGTPDWLAEYGRRRGFDVRVVPSLVYRGLPVSSTRVREGLLAGDIELVTDLLGRYPSITGRVVGGNRKGRELGYPTANIDAGPVVIPVKGVYAVFAEMEGAFLPAVMSVGTRPTFGGKELSVEVHIPGLTRDLYGCLMKVHIVTMVRKESAFSGENELRDAIEKDIKVGLEKLKSCSGA